jgi:hypothetical protein
MDVVYTTASEHTATACACIVRKRQVGLQVVGSKGWPSMCCVSFAHYCWHQSCGCSSAGWRCLVAWSNTQCTTTQSSTYYGSSIIDIPKGIQNSWLLLCCCRGSKHCCSCLAQLSCSCCVLPQALCWQGQRQWKLSCSVCAGA